jgi:hypothetical protein
MLGKERKCHGTGCRKTFKPDDPSVSAAGGGILYCSKACADTGHHTAIEEELGKRGFIASPDATNLYIHGDTRVTIEECRQYGVAEAIARKAA